MPRTLEATGRSIDEAIFNGLRELEISIDEVEIDIIQQESKGILGIGAKPAIVRLIEREPEEIIIPEYLNADSRREERRERRDRRDRGERRRRSDRPERSESAEASTEAAEENSEAIHSEQPTERRERGERSRRDRSRKSRSGESRTKAPKEPPAEYSAEAAEGNPAAEFLAGLLTHMGVEGRVLASINEEGVKLYADTPSTGVLIGHRGETLDAMQYLTSLAVNRNRKEEGYTRITLDTEGYREKREETLARLAKKIAGQVKTTGRARTLEPMNPYERRVLHSTLQDNPYVDTRSEGEEPNRRVVIFLKQKGNETEE